ncbi:hypothetical protein ABZZ80_41665 [Streptomyces sp. NPDC006356]
MGVLGVPDQLLATVTAALADPAWQVRPGAATALGGAAPDHGVPALTELLKDPEPVCARPPYRVCCAMPRTTMPVRHWRPRSTTPTPMSARTRAARRDEPASPRLPTLSPTRSGQLGVWLVCTIDWYRPKRLSVSPHPPPRPPPRRGRPRRRVRTRLCFALPLAGCGRAPQRS